MAQGNSNDDATRGRPYYEKLRKDLKQSIAKKQDLDSKLANIETAIAQYESNYLEETSAAGNIIRGFDNYIKASTTGSTSTSTGGGTATRRKGGISDADRIFSRSSVGWNSDPPTLTTNSANASNAPSATGTPTASARDTPVSTTAGPKGLNKNKKKAVEKDDDEERPTKRAKATWGRD